MPTIIDFRSEGLVNVQSREVIQFGTAKSSDHHT
jgi:hypothetical protein